MRGHVEGGAPLLHFDEGDHAKQHCAAQTEGQHEELHDPDGLRRAAAGPRGRLAPRAACAEARRRATPMPSASRTGTATSPWPRCRPYQRRGREEEATSDQRPWPALKRVPIDRIRLTSHHPNWTWPGPARTAVAAGGGTAKKKEPTPRGGAPDRGAERVGCLVAWGSLRLASALGLGIAFGGAFAGPRHAARARLAEDPSPARRRQRHPAGHRHLRNEPCR